MQLHRPDGEATSAAPGRSEGLAHRAGVAALGDEPQGAALPNSEIGR
jgi:hypothetical protein